MSNTNLTVAQYVLMTLQGVDRLNSPASINSITYNTSTDLVTIEVFGNPEDQVFKVTPIAEGIVDVIFNAKNANNEDLPSVTVTVTVTAELAVSFNVNVSEPINQ